MLLFVGSYTAVTQRELWFLGTHFSLNISKQVLTCFSLIATWHKLPPPYIYKRLYNGKSIVLQHEQVNRLYSLWLCVPLLNIPSTTYLTMFCLKFAFGKKKKKFQCFEVAQHKFIDMVRCLFQKDSFFSVLKMFKKTCPDLFLQVIRV